MGDEYGEFPNGKVRQIWRGVVCNLFLGYGERQIHALTLASRRSVQAPAVTMSLRQEKFPCLVSIVTPVSVGMMRVASQLSNMVAPAITPPWLRGWHFPDLHLPIRYRPGICHRLRILDGIAESVSRFHRRQRDRRERLFHPSRSCICRFHIGRGDRRVKIGCCPF